MQMKIEDMEVIASSIVEGGRLPEPKNFNTEMLCLAVTELPQQFSKSNIVRKGFWVDDKEKNSNTLSTTPVSKFSCCHRDFLSCL